MIVVVDASVALKWFFQACDSETDCDQALAILTAVDEDRIQLLQPPLTLSRKSLRYLAGRNRTKPRMTCLTS